MVGLIQKLLFDLIETSGGADAVREVRRRAEVPQDKEFHINEVYDDGEWRRMIAATCDVLNLTQEQAEEAFADFFSKDTQTRWPMWFQMAKNSREFLLRQPKIHNGFATSQQDAALRLAIDDKVRGRRVQWRTHRSLYFAQSTLRSLHGAGPIDHQPLRRQRRRGGSV